MPDIFSFVDYRAYLRAYYDGAKKKQEARTEYEMIAEVDFNYKDVTTRIEALSDDL